MRSTGVKRLWTHPEISMPSEYSRMSYALFRTDGDVGRVVAARAPDDRFLRVGDYIQDSLSFCDDAMAWLNCRHDSSPPLFILTDAGIGILSGKYRLSVGLGLYLHIHTRPSAAARLINNGTLGRDGRFAVSSEIRARGDKLTPRDSRSYPALLEAWQTVRSAPDRVFETTPDGSLTLHALRRGMAELASFAGCDLTFTVATRRGAPPVSPYTRVKCYRPLLPEALLLCLLSEMRARAATGSGVCRLEPHPNGGEGLALTLRYQLSREVLGTAEMYDGIHSLLSDMGETWGLDLYVFDPSPRDSEGSPEMAVTLDWLLDPSALATSDIKAHLALVREKEPSAARRGDDLQTVEEPFEEPLE